MEYFAYGRLVPNFIPVKLLSILLGMAAIVVSFYSYLGVIGQHFLWADIATFFFGVMISYWFSFRFLLRNNFTSVVAVRFAWAGFLLLFACFALFTFYPPQIALFLDPSS